MLQKDLDPQHRDVLFKDCREPFLFVVHAHVLIGEIPFEVEQSGDELSDGQLLDGEVVLEGEQRPLLG